jgi:methyl-accepting chemotaxis protein-1 (serine sensor receptor)
MLKNLTIRARLVAMVALLLILMALIAGGAIFSLNSANQSLRTVYEDRLVPVGQLDIAIRAINRVQLAATTALVNGPASYAEARVGIVAALDEQDKAWRAYVATDLTPEEATLAARARAAMDACSPGWPRATRLACRVSYAAGCQRCIRRCESRSTT